MSSTIYWCNQCNVPIIENKQCPVCGSECEIVSTNGICNPVFLQEKRLLTCILKRDVTQDNVWYLGSAKYLINGKKYAVPYREYFRKKSHIEVRDALNVNIENADHIANEELYIKANERHIKELIFEAEKYTHETLNEVNAFSKCSYMPTVSFSGGKDSTVVSKIVRDALQDEAIIHYFGDTTLEFPETYNYVEQFRKENPYTPLLPSDTENDFFKLCKVFGPPSKFERWCCTIFKTSNLNTEYQNLVGNSLTFLGIRRSESKERAKYERTQTHSKIGSQINAMPIINWDDCDVWLYILFKNIGFNNAYRWGYKRVGCWCCPNNSDWSTMLTEIYYPDLAKKWHDLLFDFAVKTKKDDIEDYINNGKWKARRGASGLETRNVSITDTPCNLSDRARNIIIDRKINRDILEFLKPFGELELFDKDDATYITITEKGYVDESGTNHQKRKVCDIIIRFGTNVLKVDPAKGIDVQHLVSRLKCQLRKYQYCIKCSACDSVCPYGAINTLGAERYTIDENICKQNTSLCSKCIAKFYNGCITCQVLSGKK